MRGKNKLLWTVVSTLAVLSLAACGGSAADGDGSLTASGTISSRSINIAPEVGGKIIEIVVDEGDQVIEGDLLFRMDDELLQSQYDQANAAVGVAQAALDFANDQLLAAKAQYEIAAQGARSGLLDFRGETWDKSPMDEFERPAWYFTQSEEIEAAQVVVDDAHGQVEEKQTELEKIVADVNSAVFVDLEKKLIQAQYALRAADRTLEIAKDAADNEELEDRAQDQYDLALSALENLQQEFDQALNTSAAEDILEARAAVGVAQTHLDSSRELLDESLIGDESLQVQAAEANMDQAESAVAQLEANLVQAEANLKILEIQLGKARVTAPVSGVLLLQNLEKGELVSAGSTVMKVGNLDEAKLTVYIPEDKLGLVDLDQEVVVTVDSFPEKSYAGRVTYISDEAEFTPNNVQTVEGRKSTVFAIEITLPNTEHDLKSGMPADVVFIMK